MYQVQHAGLGGLNRCRQGISAAPQTVPGGGVLRQLGIALNLDESIRLTGLVVSSGGVRSHGEDGFGSDRGTDRLVLPAWLAEHRAPRLGA